MKNYKKYTNYFQTIIFILVIVIFSSCDSDSDSPEVQIRELIKVAEIAAEKKDRNTMMKMISDDFQDSRQRSKKEVEQLLRYYLLRNSNIYLFVKINEIKLLSPSQVKAKLAVAMTGSPVNDTIVLSNINADLYFFELNFINQGGDDWKITDATWKRVKPIEF